MEKITLFNDCEVVTTKEVEFLPDYIVYKGDVYVQSESFPCYYDRNGCVLLEEHLH